MADCVQNCDTWDDCSSGLTWDTDCRLWYCLAQILTAGEEGNEDYVPRIRLKKKEKKKIINIYFKIFKDQLSESDRSLAKRFGIDTAHVERREINEALEVIMKSNNIYSNKENLESENKINESPEQSTDHGYTKEQIAQVKTITLEQLMKMLNVK